MFSILVGSHSSDWFWTHKDVGVAPRPKFSKTNVKPQHVLILVLVFQSKWSTSLDCTAKTPPLLPSQRKRFWYSTSIRLRTTEIRARSAHGTVITEVTGQGWKTCLAKVVLKITARDPFSDRSFFEWCQWPSKNLNCLLFITSQPIFSYF